MTFLAMYTNIMTWPKMKKTFIRAGQPNNQAKEYGKERKMCT